jgi:hypothetical protein
MRQVNGYGICQLTTDRKKWATEKDCPKNPAMKKKILKGAYVRSTASNFTSNQTIRAVCVLLLVIKHPIAFY